MSHLLLAAGLCALLLPAPGARAEEPGAAEGAAAEGAEHGEHGPSLGEVFALDNYEFWGPVVNFLAVLLIITAFGGPPIRQYLVDRRQEIEQGLTDAQQLKAEAQAKYDEYADRLDKLDQEMERIRQEMVKAGEAERDRIVADAEAKASRMRRDTQFIIEQQMKQLREDLTREAVQAAIAAAEQVLREKMTDDDQQRLAQHYLSVVGAEMRASIRTPAASTPAAPATPAAEGSHEEQA